MVIFKNPQQELYRLRLRLVVAAGFVLLCFVLLISRLVYLQIHNTKTFRTEPEANRITVVPDRAQPRPDRRPQRRGAGVATLFGLHTGDHTEQGQQSGHVH